MPQHGMHRVVFRTKSGQIVSFMANACKKHAHYGGRSKRRGREDLVGLVDDPDADPGPDRVADDHTAATEASSVLVVVAADLTDDDLAFVESRAPRAGWELSQMEALGIISKGTKPT
ncbi:hypothetical protein BV898_13575 [Hypsibius exemplaris]|uniref:Uncharacterized protein n=1 Tax=Hypsibius exemplaris TaxID=2072580 RepID=A0A1W0WAF2_HYPEX|nr:hypothetical protein BV898_13575 [Hypsibius exemplaris]